MKAALGFRRCKQNDDCEYDDDDEKHDDVAKDSDDENYEKHYASRMVAQRCDQPTAVSAAAALDEQTRDVDAENARGDISVGGQNFSVLFDTGSDALILPGSECISIACSKHRTYDEDKATTKEDSDEEVPRECHFGAGDVKGFERVNRDSGIKCLVYVTAQVLFMYMVSSCMLVDPVATDILKALLRVRVGIAHDVAFVDRSSFQSMAQQLCEEDNKLHLGEVQASLYADVREFHQGGKLLVVLCQLAWIVAILNDLRTLLRFTRNLVSLPTGPRTGFFD